MFFGEISSTIVLAARAYFITFYYPGNNAN